MLNRILKPYFIYNPKQVIKAIFWKLRGKPDYDVNTKLPWGLEIIMPPPSKDYMGHRLLMHGLVALEACETAFRLLEPGERAIDVGANLGVVTSALAKILGQKGEVYAYEPHPSTFKRLNRNLDAWLNQRTNIANIRIFNYALSDYNGSISMGLSEDFNRNIGVAYVTKGELPTKHVKFNVECRMLDELCEIDKPIHFLKIDAERHEFFVLKGALNLLSNKLIRDILFEDTETNSSKTKCLLWEYGYEIYAVYSSILGPTLTKIEKNNHSKAQQNISDKHMDFIATLEPIRLNKKFKTVGYECFKH